MKFNDHFFFFFICLTVFALHVRSISNCPNRWVKHEGSCYLAATAWTRLSYYDAMAFCASFGSHLVEFNSLAEYNYITSAAMNYSWWNGPWIGLVKPFEGTDRTWVLPSNGTRSGDSELNELINFVAHRDNQRCGGLNRRGGGFGFWDCGGQDILTTEHQKGSPWCEFELED